MIGYGGMLFESFVAIMALVAAISLNPGIYYSMNTPQASIQKLAAFKFIKQIKVPNIMLPKQFQM